jgi:hypothetical protein
VPTPLATSHLRGPLGRCYLPLTRLSGQPLGQVRGRRAEEGVVTELARLLDRLVGLGSDRVIQTLVPRQARMTGPSSPGQVRGVLYPLMSASGR